MDGIIHTVQVDAETRRGIIFVCNDNFGPSLCQFDLWTYYYIELNVLNLMWVVLGHAR